jgi:hypothetical protein
MIDRLADLRTKANLDPIIADKKFGNDISSHAKAYDANGNLSK